MKKVTVDFSDVAEMMEMERLDNESYLDTETGDVILLSGEVLDDIRNEEDLGDLLDWQRDEASIAKAIEEDEEHRFAYIPEIETHKAYKMMEDFVNTMNDDVLRAALEDAIHGRGAFSRFRRAFDNNEAERMRWYEYKQDRINLVIRDWLEGLGIDATDKCVGQTNTETQDADSD